MLSLLGKPAQPIWVLKALSNQFSPFVLTAALPARTSPPPHSRYPSTGTFLTHGHPSSPTFSTLPQGPHIQDACSRSSLGCALCPRSSLDRLQLFFPTLPATSLHAHRLQTAVGPCTLWCSPPLSLLKLLDLPLHRQQLKSPHPQGPPLLPPHL